jgi:tetratricopeptide (TPR) repeat protein
MTHRALVTGFAFLLASTSGVALAQTPQEQSSWCRGEHGVAGKRRIDACAALIGSGRYAGKELAPILVNRGDVYLEAMDFEHALADYEKAIALDQNLAAAHLGRGAVFTYKIARDDPDRAIVEFNTALVIEPNNAKAYLGRARAYQHKCGACPDAVRDASDAVRLAANDKDTLLDALDLRSDLLIVRGDLDGAIRDYDELIRLYPPNGGALAARGDAFRRQHKLDRALADYDAAIGIDATDWIYFHGRGRVYQDMGDLDRAIADYSAAIRLGSDSPYFVQVLRDRASAYRAKGDAAHAEADEAEAKRRGG